MISMTRPFSHNPWRLTRAANSFTSAGVGFFRRDSTYSDESHSKFLSGTWFMALVLFWLPALLLRAQTWITAPANEVSDASANRDAHALKATVRAQTGASASPDSSKRIRRPLLAPIDQSTQEPLVSNVRSGFMVELWVGHTRIATSAPVTTGSTLTRVRLPHRLSPGQIVRAREKRGPITSQFSDPVIVENNYVTNRYDNERSGWNPHESTLTKRKVQRSFGKVCEHIVDGLIHAQPLYVQDVDIPGKGRHNVVFAATDGDEVWAFDADSCSPSDQGLWKDGFGRPSPRKLLGPGETVRSTLNCNGSHGILSTPAIDRASNTIYVVAAVENAQSHQTFFRLHALDISTGSDRATAIVDGTTAFTHGSTVVHFNPNGQLNRPGLLLDGAVLYLGFGSCQDQGEYHGWVVAYDAALPGSPTYLTQKGVFNTTPEVVPPISCPPCGAGVWQGGLGLAADGDGTVYFMTGNGDFDASKGGYGDTLLRLRLSTNPSQKEMQVVNFFTPWDWNTAYNPLDTDLGSGGPILFRSGSRRFVLGGGKLPKSYLIDRDCTNCSGDPNRCKATTGNACTSDDPNLVLQTLRQPTGIVAAPTYYIGPAGLRIYYGFGVRNPSTAFSFQLNPPSLVSPTNSLQTAPCTSPIPAISSNSNLPGSGILWEVFHPGSPSGICASLPPWDRLTLHAYDAENITDDLFSSTHPNGLDIAGWGVTMGGHTGNSFQVPTVIHGKVYAGSEDRLVVFGLVPPPRPGIVSAAIFPRLQCASSVGCNDSVEFSCAKRTPTDVFQLQQKVNGEWRAATTDTGAGMLNLENFVLLWDYPDGNMATERVCLKDQPDNCTPEVALTLQHARCVQEYESLCGRRGKPPCRLVEPWPVSGPERVKAPSLPPQ